ncbi:hypothetical protein ABPG74_014585 [Tetrahymena malaccensis]
MNNQPDLFELIVFNERKNILFHYDLVNDKESDEMKIQILEKLPRIQNLCGLVAALKELNKKFSPFPTQNVKFFKSSFYKFSLYDSPGGIKIILLSSNNDYDYSDILEEIFLSAYIDLVQRNPLYQSNTIIKNPAFTSKIKSIFQNQQLVQSKIN